MGEKRWYIVECYLTAVDGETIQDVEVAIAERPRGTELIVGGDLNVDLEKASGRGQDEEIAMAVALACLGDLEGNFLMLQQVWSKDRRTWEVVRQGKVGRSRTDYILGSDHWIFQNVAVWDLMHNSHHFMILGCLNGASPKGKLSLPQAQDAPPTMSTWP